MTRFFKAIPPVYESMRASIDAGRGYPSEASSGLGEAYTATSFPPAADAPTNGTHCYLALHDWQFAGMPDAAALLAANLGTLILESTLDEYKACFTPLDNPL